MATMRTWKTPAGSAYKLYLDMLEQHHLMIAGTIGSGKSVLINALIYTALFYPPCDIPGGVQFILLDRKRVELARYKNLPHTLRFATEPAEMVQALEYAVQITDERYREMEHQGVLKYGGGQLYVIIDEFADLVLSDKKHVQPLVQRLSQIGRAAGVHVILATQCPLSCVIPTPIKVCFDSRVALRTECAQDSRNIIRVPGCELLPDYGKGYYKTAKGIKRCNIRMISEKDIAERVQWWENQKQTQPRRKFREILHDVVGMLIVILIGNLLK